MSAVLPVVDRAFASFDRDWATDAYLAEYFSVVEPDERELIAFLTRSMAHVDRAMPMLQFGTGPVLSCVFPAAPHASEIHLAEYLPANRAAIARWLASDPDAHDWRPFVRHALRCEGVRDPSLAEIRQRVALSRARIRRLLPCDVRRPEALVPGADPSYATVVSAFCADSITADRATWRVYMRRIAGLVRPGGVLLVAALHRATWYEVGGRRFPSADIDAADMRDVLEPALDVAALEVHPVPGCARLGYRGIILARAHRR